MTSEEIKLHKIEGSTDPSYYLFEIAQWLKENAYQSALLNERFIPILDEERERSKRYRQEQELREKAKNPG
jgi:hypothetical protein